MMYIAVPLFIVFTFELLKVTILKLVFEKLYMAALKTQHRKRAARFGILYYSCLSRYQRRIENITDIRAAVNNDLHNHQMTIVQY